MQVLGSLLFFLFLSHSSGNGSHLLCQLVDHGKKISLHTGLMLAPLRLIGYFQAHACPLLPQEKGQIKEFPTDRSWFDSHLEGQSS